jgi:putative aminophosphonate oxidoreductase
MMRSYWLNQVLERSPARPRPLSGDITVDICIVGGGFTGLWTALHIKETDPSADIAIIERDICGGGASGRNGGFCMTWSSKVPLLHPVCGGQETVRMVEASEAAVRAIGRFCADNEIECEFRHDGWLWTASSETQRDAWRGVIDVLDRLGLHPFDELSRDEVARRSGSTRHIAGVYEKGTATVQPAALARGLARVCAERGVRIYENTAMTGLGRSARPWVRTDRGMVKATKIVLALNAWAHELPEFRRAVMPICADGIATAPIPEKLETLGLRDGLAISDSRTMVDYYRRTADGRMVYGKGGGAIPFAGRVGSRFDTESSRSGEIREAMLRNYPELAETSIVATWRGPATRTATGLPMFGRMKGAPAVIYGHGYIGNGVGPSYNGGRILAALALDRRDEWAECPLVGGEGKLLPPEPFRYCGGLAVRAAVRAKDRADDQGRKSNLLTRYLAGLAPSGLTARTGDRN